MQYAFVDIGNSSAKCCILTQRTLGNITEDNVIKIKKKLILSWVKKVDCNTMLWFVASVVPYLDESLADYLGSRVRFISSCDVKGIGLNLISKPIEVGIDRLLCSLAVFKITQEASLIISGGTAITFNIVNHLGEFMGGVIVPGLDLAKSSLHQSTEKLPIVSKLVGVSLNSKRTQDAISSGIYYGYIEMINGLIEKYKKFTHLQNVFATGYGLEPLLKHLKLDVYDPCLTLKGLIHLVHQDEHLNHGIKGFF